MAKELTTKRNHALHDFSHDIKIGKDSEESYKKLIEIQYQWKFINSTIVNLDIIKERF